MNRFYVFAGVGDDKKDYYLKDNCKETTLNGLKAKKFKSLKEIKKFREDNLDWLNAFEITKIEIIY